MKRSANVSTKYSHQMCLLMASLTTAKDQDTMRQQRSPMKNVIVSVHLISTKAPMTAREVIALKEKRDVVKIEMKLLVMSMVEKSKSSKKGKQMHVLPTPAEGQDIRLLTDTMMCVTETAVEVEVVVDLMRWSEDIPEREETLMMILRNTGVKEWRINILSITVESTSDIVKIDKTVIKVIDGSEPAVLI